jgi:hypothetical protein
VESLASRFGTGLWSWPRYAARETIVSILAHHMRTHQPALLTYSCLPMPATALGSVLIALRSVLIILGSVLIVLGSVLIALNALIALAVCA